MTCPFTGRHMAAIMVAFFAVVVAVNFFMARQASATFGGVVVDNSYVASQRFNRWLDEAAAQDALGWRADAARLPDGRIAVSIAGPAAHESVLRGSAKHPLGRESDETLSFVLNGEGRFVSREPLPPGRWRLRLDLRANGTTWRSEGDIR